MALTTHLMACGWFILACSSMSAEAGDPHTCGRDSWAMQMHMLDGSNNHLSTGSTDLVYMCIYIERDREVIELRTAVWAA